MSPIDRDSVGQRGDAFVFPVEAGKIHELARATFSTQAAYLAEQPIAQPTFLKLSQFNWEVPGHSAVDLVNFDRTNPPLHAEQDFRYTGPPPRAGDILRGQTVVESIEDKPSRTYGWTTAVVIATEYHDDAGWRVAVARSTSMARPAPGDEPPPGLQSSPRSAPSEAATPMFTPPAQLPPPPAPRSTDPLTLTDLVRYQGAGGDMNPSHHDDQFAKGNGSPGVFAPGLLSAALLGDWATSWLGPDKVRRFGVRFRSQVFLGDVLTCSGTVTGGTANEVEVALECRRQDGSVATAGWATFVL